MTAPIAFANADDLIVPWVAERIPMPASDFGMCTALGITLDGQTITCGVVFNEYRVAEFGNSLQATIAADRPGWATKRTLEAMFAYPFSQMGCSRLWVQTAKRNRKARRLAERLGFKYEGTARQGWDGKADSCVYAMLPHECQWICRA